MNDQSIRKKPSWSELPHFSQQGFDVLTYLQIHLTPDLLITLTCIYFPEFVLYKGAVILKFRFDAANFETWFEHFKGNIREVEVMLNTIELASHLFPAQLANQSYENIEFIGEKLKDTWKITLSVQFPDRKFTVIGEKHQQFDDYVITFWQD